MNNFALYVCTLLYDASFIAESMSESCPVPEAMKKPQTKTFPPPCFTAGMSLF